MRSFHRALALAAALLSADAAAAPVELCVLEWEGYISPFAADFEAHAKSQGLDVKLVFPTDGAGKPLLITSADDIFQMVRGQRCDVVTPTNNYYKDSGSRLLKSLAPIDLSLVPNFQQISENLKSADYATEDGKRYAVPLLGGGYSLAYNADRVPVPPSSWAALTEDRFKGRISVTGAQYEANIYVAAILAGTPPAQVYALDAIDQARVAAILGKIAGNAAALWDANPDLDLMAKDLDLITDYGFGVAFANAKGQNWKFAAPREPTTVWLDNVSLAPGAVSTPERKRASHLLLDYLLSPAVQARLVYLYGVVVPNPRAIDHLAPEKRAQARIGTDDFFKPDLFWQPLDRRTRNGFKILWNQAVDTAKAASR